MLVLAWIILVVLAYRVSLIEIEHKEYDPFAVLDIDRVGFSMMEDECGLFVFFLKEASISEIKRAYRDLSKKHHPDRGGDAEQFVSDWFAIEERIRQSLICRKKLPKHTRH